MTIDVDSEDQRRDLLRWLANGLIGRWGQTPPAVRTDIVALASAMMDCDAKDIEAAISELQKRSKAPKR